VIKKYFLEVIVPDILLTNISAVALGVAVEVFLPSLQPARLIVEFVGL